MKYYSRILFPPTYHLLESLNFLFFVHKQTGAWTHTQSSVSLDHHIFDNSVLMNYLFILVMFCLSCPNRLFIKSSSWNWSWSWSLTLFDYFWVTSKRKREQAVEAPKYSALRSSWPHRKCAHRKASVVIINWILMAVDREVPEAGSCLLSSTIQLLLKTTLEPLSLSLSMPRAEKKNP